MTPSIEEAHRLLRLAERDLQTYRILAAHPDASLAAACFHPQQSVEKALTVMSGIAIPILFAPARESKHVRGKRAAGAVTRAAAALHSQCSGPYAAVREKEAPLDARAHWL
ncbi:MAG TPA: HEPN domain-containing protein [Candidatus Accumulibacter phosphatis]|nr:MAG: hypothetical protein AW07_03003 [Candidatus Accumulibacter sp. SK-11]HAY26702.1 hypothetical protein [Accumulibacter sp.]HRL77344.1 HEPN domain-containing protein [Candidatus Accumulibacter phosphatis]HRQ95436.1 HEPN domain-containing protein [Candidatus Accumulibacter phosphatis]